MAKAERSFSDDVQAVAEPWERRGWLFTWRDEAAREMWELTPLGHRMLRTEKAPTIN